MTNNLKLLNSAAGAEQPETAPQPTFPSTRYQVTADGLLISYILAPGYTVNGGIGEKDMNAICKAWLESRKQIKNELEMIRNIEKGKLH